MMASVLTYLPAILAGVVFAVLGLCCFLWSQRTLERSPKQLDWIRRHDRGGYPFVREALPSVPADWLGVFGAAVFALVAAIAYQVVSQLMQGASWQVGLFSISALISVLLSVLGAVCMYFLLQRLFGSTLISACGTLLFAASGVSAHSAGCLLTGALLLLVLWLTSPRPLSRPFPTELLYWGACLLFCIALALRPSLLPLGLLFVGFHLFKLISALRHDELSFGSFALLLALGLLVWILGLVLYGIVETFMYFGYSFATLQRLATRHGILRLILSRWKLALNVSVQRLLRSRVLLPLLDAPLVGLGGFGLLSGLLLWTRRQDARAKLILPIALALLVPWLLSDTSVLSVGLTLSAALLFHNFLRDRVRLPVICMTVLGVVFYIAFYVLAFLLPFSPSLLIRLR